MLDPSIFSRIKTKQDFDREREEFEARKRQQAMQEQLGQQQLSLGNVQIDQAKKDLEMGINRNDPAAVREYNFFSQLTPQEQEQYLGMKRAQQTLNLGGTQAVLNPLGGIQQQYTVTPKMSEMPEFQAMQAGAAERAKLQEQLSLKPQLEMQTSRAKSGAERQSELSELQATLPQLMNTVEQLSNLGKVATYTTSGQVADAARRELGLSVGEGAVARKEYESLVNNQILPLLRQTFGAQFTEREGEQLRKTLGDVNASPEEKDAVLRSFIDQKTQQIQTLQRQLDPEQMSRDAIIQGQQKIGENPAQRQSLTPQQIDESIFNAKKAISAGKDPAMIKQRLMDAGIDPAMAGL